MNKLLITLASCVLLVSCGNETEQQVTQGVECLKSKGYLPDILLAKRACGLFIPDGSIVSAAEGVNRGKFRSAYKAARTFYLYDNGYEVQEKLHNKNITVGK